MSVPPATVSAWSLADGRWLSALAALPLAALGPLDRVVAGAAVAFAGVLVVGDGLRLRRFTPRAR